MSGGSIGSPNVSNYYVGKGVMSVQLPGDANYIEIGNVPSFEFLAKPTLLPHFSSMTGISVKDLVAVTRKEATLTIVMEEFTGRNLAMMLMATNSFAEPGGNVTMDFLSDTIVHSKVKFRGTNTIGPNWEAIFPNVILTPAKAINMISEQWGAMELTGDVLADPSTGFFGTITATLATSPGFVFDAH